MDTLAKNNMNWEIIIPKILIVYIKYIIRNYSNVLQEKNIEQITQSFFDSVLNEIEEYIKQNEISLNKMPYEKSKKEVLALINDTVTYPIYKYLGHYHHDISESSFTAVMEDRGFYEFEKKWFDSSFNISNSDILQLERITDRIALFNKPEKKIEILIFSELDYKIFTEIIQNPKVLSTLHWRMFEKLLADILESFQYEVELTQGSKDGGIDIIAIRKDSHFGLHRYLLQAKRYKNKVHIEPVRSLLFTKQHYGATKACLATTSTFTSGAWELASLYKWSIELIEKKGLLNWIYLAAKIKGLI